jgi:hypothetical protein
MPKLLGWPLRSARRLVIAAGQDVLHDWDDERSIAILQSCRAAMDQAARLAILELLLPERMTPSAGVTGWRVSG